MPKIDYLLDRLSDVDYCDPHLAFHVKEKLKAAEALVREVNRIAKYTPTSIIIKASAYEQIGKTDPYGSKYSKNISNGIGDEE